VPFVVKFFYSVKDGSPIRDLGDDNNFPIPLSLHFSLLFSVFFAARSVSSVVKFFYSIKDGSPIRDLGNDNNFPLPLSFHYPLSIIHYPFSIALISSFSIFHYQFSIALLFPHRINNSFSTTLFVYPRPFRYGILKIERSQITSQVDH